MRKSIQLAIVAFGIFVILYVLFLPQPPFTAPPTRTPCDPKIVHYLSSSFSVQLSKSHPPQTNEPSYRPGEVVIVSGYVALYRQDAFLDECNNSIASAPVRDDAQNVTVSMNGPLGASISKVQVDGSFTLTLAIPNTTQPGTYQCRVLAEYESPTGQIYSDTATVVVAVQ